MGTSIGHIQQSTIPDSATNKRGVRTQFAALCFRGKGSDTQVLLVTSRTTRRWIVPKGWPMAGLTPVEAAEREAWEEAGVKGKIAAACLGIYSYTKLLEDEGDDLPCVVALFPLKVDTVASRFPERRQRQRKWFSPKKAAERVDEPELAQLILNFKPELYFGKSVLNH
ncbi:NUDIX hydrolase [Frigidibacter sp. ROC022]|uniref:NUDIX hydrolase n=1 Tax=Frigidibacter sp. ROC022 TaxID=2971796 RepID=UPI00215AFC72|nr:NUDIX hydrolase [Frigidibacter sp. ROC022]MCR8726637.1 NUDIX hydrolase [Frigidibacter sp. ROC022]